MDCPIPPAGPHDHCHACWAEQRRKETEEAEEGEPPAPVLGLALWIVVAVVLVVGAWAGIVVAGLSHIT